jgi:uncharacterized protein (TIGR02145 family)
VANGEWRVANLSPATRHFNYLRAKHNQMRFLFLSIITLLGGVLFAQAPALIPYQAVARDASGQALNGATINARFTIHEGAATGAAVWQELQTVTTSALGLFTAQLGSSVSLTGVNWANGSKFMQVEIDLGQGFVDMGTQQMLSVPYALHAGSVSLNVSATGDTLFVGNGEFVIIPGISEANINDGNEILGCTDNNACNYNSSATADDGSCYSSGEPCNDENPNTICDLWTADCVCVGSTSASDHTCGYSCVHNENLSYGSLTDQQGNVYKTIVIGSQEWMAENLNTSVYRNGDPISIFSDNDSWASTSDGAWTYYLGDVSYACPFGKLYNWYACVDSRELCPQGWHMPTDAEWTVLGSFLGGDEVAGGKMKTRGTVNDAGIWITTTTGTTNSSGFSAVPSGYRFDWGNYGGANYDVWWWSSTQYVDELAYLRSLGHSVDALGRDVRDKNKGCAVRCLRD